MNLDDYQKLQVMFNTSNLCHIETGEENEAGIGIPVCSMPKKLMPVAERLVQCYNMCYGLTEDQIAEVDAILSSITWQSGKSTPPCT